MSALLRRNSGQADGGTMAIAGHRKPYLEEAAGVQLPAAAELRESGWFTMAFAVRRKPTGGCVAILRPVPLPRSLAVLLLGRGFAR